MASQKSVTLRKPNGERTKMATVLNISLGGLFIEMDDPVAFGSELTIEFELPESPRALRCQGFVVWNTKAHPENAPGRQGIGVRLSDISIAEMRHVARFMDGKLET